MLPYATLLHLDKKGATPLYVQLSEQLGQLIRAGTLSAGQRLPGTRLLANQLAINRQTVVAAYDDLLAQGWLDSRTGSGTFVADHMPTVTPLSFNELERTRPKATPVQVEQPGYAFETRTYLTRPALGSPAGLRFDDGLPDARLAPLDELSRAYRSYFRWGNPQAHFGYNDTKGNSLLREQLSAHLNETRGLRTTSANILITRGSIMGIHLTSQVLLRPGDVVVTGETTWTGATMNARQAGAQLLTVPVDVHGLNVDALADLCARQPIRMVYVTPHHHYPTTVTMRADRRIRLLQLAEHYRFAILEDDYDYDFHYLGRPILPLASADPQGMVVYVGSLTKSVAPAFRVGYVVGPTALIDEMARLRRIIDRQGDPALEFAIGQLFQSGEMKRHFRKAIRTYEARRDHLCRLLTSELYDQIQFTKPDGGLAIWATFNQDIDLEAIAERTGRAGLYLSSGLVHNLPGQLLNSTRMGFASSTEAELEQAVVLLKSLM
ncbi:aminotransferase-like domain-containing protein [Fibrella forsythiae]|uniref:PLP-dependent aminotransferase family protein n=1 Tax=Fibrella forsythiae TaxID=2817061 RepID=A0ABS3JM01_9BACT|nr:PLP-dependent aminotransferase family protein [Fibrella forsythiae]MBO0950488.1 PLP-dependent aminotransferase family protein [Fibrella forsythiae]